MNYNKDEIYNLLLEKIAGCISIEDNIEIEKYIKQDEETRSIWNKLQEKHQSKGAKFLKSIDEQQAWKKVKQAIDQPQPLLKPKRPYFQKWLAIAAMLMVILATAIFFYPQTRNKAVNDDNHHKNLATTSVENKVELKLANGKSIAIQENGTLALGNTQLNMKDGKLKYMANDDDLNWNTLTVPARMNYKLELSDGTEVWMNSASNLKFPFNFTGATREVYLEGEAYFIVAKDIKKPFIVHTQGTHIKVLGTSFNINSYGLEVITSLVEGAVVNNAAQQSVLMKPGTQATYSSTSGFTQKPFEADRVLSWMQGIYYFDDIPLANMTAVIKRWFNVNLVVDNPKISNLTFTGAIEKNKSLDSFISNLEATSGIKAYLKNGELHLK